MTGLAEENVYRSLDGYNLVTILCSKEEWVLQNDFTLSYKNRVLQLDNQQKTIIRPKNRSIKNAVDYVHAHENDDEEDGIVVSLPKESRVAIASPAQGVISSSIF